MMHFYKFYMFYRYQSLETDWNTSQILIINMHFYLLTEFNRLPTKIENFNRLSTSNEILTDNRQVDPPFRPSLRAWLIWFEDKVNDVVHFPGRVIGAIECTYVRIICPNEENAIVLLFLLSFCHTQKNIEIKLKKKKDEARKPEEANKACV